MQQYQNMNTGIGKCEGCHNTRDVMENDKVPGYSGSSSAGFCFPIQPNGHVNTGNYFAQIRNLNNYNTGNLNVIKTFGNQEQHGEIQMHQNSIAHQSKKENMLVVDVNVDTETGSSTEIYSEQSKEKKKAKHKSSAAFCPDTQDGRSSYFCIDSEARQSDQSCSPIRISNLVKRAQQQFTDQKGFVLEKVENNMSKNMDEEYSEDTEKDMTVVQRRRKNKSRNSGTSSSHYEARDNRAKGRTGEFAKHQKMREPFPKKQEAQKTPITIRTSMADIVRSKPIVSPAFNIEHDFPPLSNEVVSPSGRGEIKQKSFTDVLKGSGSESNDKLEESISDASLNAQKHKQPRGNGLNDGGVNEGPNAGKLQPDDESVDCRDDQVEEGDKSGKSVVTVKEMCPDQIEAEKPTETESVKPSSAGDSEEPAENLREDDEGDSNAVEPKNPLKESADGDGDVQALNAGEAEGHVEGLSNEGGEKKVVESPAEPAKQFAEIGIQVNEAELPPREEKHQPKPNSGSSKAGESSRQYQQFQPRPNTHQPRFRRPMVIRGPYPNHPQYLMDPYYNYNQPIRTNVPPPVIPKPNAPQPCLYFPPVMPHYPTGFVPRQSWIPLSAQIPKHLVNNFNDLVRPPNFRFQNPHIQPMRAPYVPDPYTPSSSRSTVNVVPTHEVEFTSDSQTVETVTDTEHASRTATPVANYSGTTVPDNPVTVLGNRKGPPTVNSLSVAPNYYPQFSGIPTTLDTLGFSPQIQKLLKNIFGLQDGEGTFYVYVLDTQANHARQFRCLLHSFNPIAVDEVPFPLLLTPKIGPFGQFSPYGYYYVSEEKMEQQDFARKRKIVQFRPIYSFDYAIPKEYSVDNMPNVFRNVVKFPTFDEKVKFPSVQGAPSEPKPGQ